MRTTQSTADASYFKYQTDLLRDLVEPFGCVKWGVADCGHPRAHEIDPSLLVVFLHGFPKS